MPRRYERVVAGASGGLPMSVPAAAYLSRMTERFGMQMVFPLEGDTAIVELLHDGEQWAELRLDGLRLDAVGEDRLQGAHIVLTVIPAEDGSAREFELDDARGQLDDARDWLIENERGRRPGGGAGASTKISRLDERWEPDER
jgi:hypothetical protein